MCHIYILLLVLPCFIASPPPPPPLPMAILDALNASRLSPTAGCCDPFESAANIPSENHLSTVVDTELIGHCYDADIYIDELLRMGAFLNDPRLLTTTLLSL